MTEQLEDALAGRGYGSIGGHPSELLGPRSHDQSQSAPAGAEQHGRVPRPFVSSSSSSGSNDSFSAETAMTRALASENSGVVHAPLTLFNNSRTVRARPYLSTVFVEREIPEGGWLSSSSSNSSNNSDNSSNGSISIGATAMQEQVPGESLENASMDQVDEGMGAEPHNIPSGELPENASMDQVVESMDAEPPNIPPGESPENASMDQVVESMDAEPHIPPGESPENASMDQLVESMDAEPHNIPAGSVASSPVGASISNSSQEEQAGGAAGGDGLPNPATAGPAAAASSSLSSSSSVPGIQRIQVRQVRMGALSCHPAGGAISRMHYNKIKKRYGKLMQWQGIPGCASF